MILSINFYFFYNIIKTNQKAARPTKFGYFASERMTKTDFIPDYLASFNPYPGLRYRLPGTNTSLYF